jgi:hypothetical protein
MPLWALLNAVFYHFVYVQSLQNLLGWLLWYPDYLFRNTQLHRSSQNKLRSWNQILRNRPILPLLLWKFRDWFVISHDASCEIVVYVKENLRLSCF